MVFLVELLLKMRLFNIPLLAIPVLMILTSNGFSAGERYRVGVYQNEPYVIIDSSGKVEGICVEVIEEIAAREGWLLEYDKGTWHECLEKIVNGKLDMLLAVAYLKEREETICFSREMLLITWAQIFAKKEAGIKSTLDLKGKIIAVEEDDIYNEGIRSKTTGFGLECEFIECPDYHEVFQKVKAGEADAGVVDRVFGKMYGKKSELVGTSVVLSPIEVRVAYRKGSLKEPRHTIDKYLGEMINDPESVLNRSIDKYIAFGERKKARYFFIRNVAYAIIGLSLVIISLVVVRKLHKSEAELSEKSSELEKENESRRQAEQLLGLTEERYRRLFEFSPNGIVILGQDGTILDANKAAAELAGMEWRASLSLNVEEIKPIEKYIPLLRDKFREIRIEKQLEPFEIEIIPVGGTKARILSVQASSIDHEEDTMIQVIITDITQKKMLEDQMMQIQKMDAIGTLTGGIAHDFNNLLTGILGYSNMLKINHIDDEEVSSAAEIIEKAAERASRLTTQLIGFAREGKHLVQTVDMHRVINDAMIVLERTIERNVRITGKPLADLPFVSGDPNQLEQVILNLFLNARDAMPAGGKILIKTENVDLDEAYCSGIVGMAPGKYLMIAVEDTGSGIPKDLQSRVFEPFFTTKEKGEGTGMGLAMVYGIVSNHGGNICVYSEEGMGATFKILLPVDESAHEDARTTETVIPFIGTGTIMVVDDEEIVLSVAREMLEKLGYVVKPFRDCLKAIRYFKQNQDDIDLVIIDMIMPGIDGAEVFSKLKKINPEVKAILSSGFILDERAQKLLKEGMKGFLQKPFIVTQLSRIVAKALKQ